MKENSKLIYLGKVYFYNELPILLPADFERHNKTYKSILYLRNTCQNRLSTLRPK